MKSIIAGIDEAGYGPLLGPLVVGCCAIEIELMDGESLPEGDELPCLWKRLRRCVSRKRSKTGRTIHVNDSKLVYSPSVGLRELERSLLTLAACFGESMPDTLDALLLRVAARNHSELLEHDWYHPYTQERFPIEQEALPLRLLANAMRLEMQRTRTRGAMLMSQVMPERHLNRQLALTHNKSSVLFSLAAMHIDTLLRAFSDQNLVICCDRHGGRDHYGRLLQLMFPEWALEVLSEGNGQSDYRLSNGRRSARILFREKAETHCMSVAIASMLSKYLREALMRRFNHWWLSDLPDVAPTAGYHQDGMRFLREIERKRRSIGLADELLIRSR